MTKDKMVGWHHQLNGHEFDRALGDGKGQGSLGCCSPWDNIQGWGQNGSWLTLTALAFISLRTAVLGGSGFRELTCSLEKGPWLWCGTQFSSPFGPQKWNLNLISK